MKKLILISILILGFAHLSMASDLKLPMDLYSTGVLPKGVRNLRFRGMVVNGNEKFNEVGAEVPLADPFYKNVTWNDLVDPKTDPENKNLLSGYLDSKGVDKSEVVGKTTGDVHVEARPVVPIFAFGLTDKLTLALAIPVIKYRTSSQTGFTYDENLRKVYNQLKDDNKIAELNELSRKMVNPIETKLKDFGYDPIKDEKGTLMGDISLTTKYLAYKGDGLSVTAQASITAPTGKGKNEDKLISIGSDKIWSAGIAAITDYRASSWLCFSSATGYKYKLADTIQKRVPYREDSKVTPDKDDKVKRKLGDEIFGQLGAEIYPGDGFTFLLGYTFQYKGADKYEGSKYSKERYQWMGKNTIQRVETITGGLKLDTIALFKKKQFAAPLELALSQSLTLRGKNAAKDSLTTLDLSLFF